MKRKLLLFSLLLALFAPWAAQAQTTVEIGDGTTTSYNATINTYFHYSLTQQIFTADEIAEAGGFAGTISSISFNMSYASTSDYTMPGIKLYMLNTDKEVFDSNNDLVDVTDSDIVYEGDFVLPTGGGWITLPVSDFAYEGGNLLVCIYDPTSGYPGSSYKFYCTSTGSNHSSIQWYSDSQNPNPANLAAYSGSKTYNTFHSNIRLDITPGSGPVCNRPDEVIAENITTNSATILWTGGSGTYNVEYKKTTDETWTSAITNTTETSVELTGLTPGTNYQAKVQSVCVFDDTTMYRDRSVNFATSFGIPLIEPFATTTFPTGWSRYTGLLSDVMNGTALTTTTSGWLIGNYNNVFDTHTRVNIYGTTCKYWLVTPTLLMEDNVELSFDLALTVYTSGSSASPTPGNQADDRFVVLITTDGGATWEILREWNNTGSEYVYDSITNASTGQYETIDLSSYAGQNIAVAFYGQSTVSGGDNNLHVDNISIDYIPSCPKPSGLAYSEVTGHTALLTWTPNGVGQTQWQICLNGDEENLQLVTSTDGSYTLTGLTGVTPYTAKVRAYCSEEDQSPWSNQVSFTTDVTCVAPTAFAVSDVTNRNVKLNWTSEGTDWIVAYKLTSAPDSTYVEVPVTEKPYILEGLAPETGYTVRVRNNCGEVDGLSTWSATRTFTTLVAYPAPINVAVDSVFAYTAYLSWDELGTAMDWEVAYRFASDTIYDYSLAELTPDNHPFLLGDYAPLTPDSLYFFKVRSVYMDLDTVSEWSEEKSFRTLQTCPAPTEVAVIDSTINAYGATLNWEAIYSDSYNVAVIPYEVVIETMVNTGFEDNEIPSAFTNSTSYPWTVTEGGANGSSYCAIPGNIGVNSSSSDLTFVVTGPASVSFNAKVSSESSWDYGRFLVDGSQRMQISGTQDWTAYSYELTEGEHTLVWRYYKDSSGASGNDLFYVDDIIVAGSSIVMLEGFNYPAEEATITLNDLQPETHYIVKVTSHCGEEMSEESETVTFTTKPSCLAPTDLVVIDSTITAHTATLSWTENGSATEWVIEYTTSIDGQTVTDYINNVTTNPYTFEGLVAETTYDIRVLASCGPNDPSQWSNMVSFTTLVACPAPTELAVDVESITTTGATVTWNGNSDSYIVMIGEPDPDSLAMGTLINVDFENQVIPSTWENDATYPWVITNASANGGTFSVKSSNNGVNNSTSAIQITVDFLGNGTISFAARCSSEQTNESYDWDYGTFYIDGVQQGNKFINSDTFESRSYDVAAGTHTFMWRYKKDGSVGSYDDCFYVDDIVVTTLMPVPASWDEYPADEATYTFDELEPGTTYYVKVKSDCGQEGESVESNMISFTTIASCPAPTDFAVTQVTGHTATMVWNGENNSYVVNYRIPGHLEFIDANFENGELPAGWTSEGAATWSVGTGDYSASTGAHGGNYNAYITHGTTGNVTYLVTPNMDLSERSDLTLGLWYINRQWVNDIDGFGVYYRIDGGEWNEIFATTEAHSVWTQLSQALPEGAYAANCQFGFKFTDAYGYGVGLDDITLGDMTETGEWIPVAANDTTVVVEGLAPMTTYEARLQGVCDGEESDWTEIITFTTIEACPAPTGLAVINDSITAHSAYISWVENGLAAAWQICLNDDMDNLIEVTDTTVYMLTGLRQDYNYTVKVRANCGDEDGTSNWSNVVSFTTLMTCFPVTNLVVDTVGTHMAVISWTEAGDATAWEICVDDDEDNLIAVNDTTTFMVEGLSQDNDHTVKVRANCGDEGPSSWSTVSFHTLVACFAPTNLAADNIGTETVNLTWDGESDSYIVQYMPWEQVGEDQTSTGVMVTYTYDLSEYEGMGSIAIRHYDVSDVFRLNVDDIVVKNAQDEVVFSEDFEGTISSQLSLMDLDGDGYNWEYGTNGNDAIGNPLGNGSYFITSASYDNTYGALTPDNWLIISGVELGGQLTFVARAQDPEWTAENFAVFVSPEAGAGEEIVDGDTSLEIVGLDPNTSYSVQVASICDDETSNWIATFITTLDDALVFVTNGDWNNAENWQPNELPTSGKNVRIVANAIIPAGVVAEANKVTIDGGSITIKDGGQLKQSSATLQVTMEKEITGYGEGNGNYYLISSPFTGRTQFGASTWNHVDSLIYGSYDLYTFDPTYGEDQEWVNYKAHPEHINYQSEAQGNAGLFEEVGYLYANQESLTLAFIGKTGKSNNASTEPKTLAYDTINKGWALMGNVYACNAYLTAVDSEGNPMEANYYVMNATGDNLELAETTDGIAPLNSAFIYLDTTGYYQLHSEMPEPAKFNRTGKFIMSLNQGTENVDQAIVRIGKGRNLQKMSLKNNSKLYFSMRDKDYAVVYSLKADNMPVSFKAESAGSYTINFAADGVSFKELVLIDNATETKVDLLANPSYTFETEAGEFAGRFTIKYVVK